MELTQEHFDKTIKGLATKSDIQDLKSDMTAMETRLIDRIDESQQELAGMIARGFADFKHQLDVRKEVEVLEKQMYEVRQELNLA